MNAQRVASYGLLIALALVGGIAAMPAEASVCATLAGCQGPADLIGQGLGGAYGQCTSGSAGTWCVSAE